MKIVKQQENPIFFKGITRIQALWRGYRVRRNLLSRSLFNLAKVDLDRCIDITCYPKASSGITPVYFPPHLPIAFKALGETRSKKRFFVMWEARDLCIKNGYTHLLIPQAYPYKNYNIEDKLPVEHVKQREQLALYCDNRDQFTEAVKEFTGFLCQCIFPDILTFNHPYQNEKKFPIGRCDNLPLLLDRGMGKIALIDLGGHQIRKEKLTLIDALECAKTAISIFPYHSQDILEVVAFFYPEISQKASFLQSFAKQSLKNLNIIYKNHCRFISQNNTPLLFSSERTQEILQNAKKSLGTEGILLSEKSLLQLVNEITLSILAKFKEFSISDTPLHDQACARFIVLNVNQITQIFENTDRESNRIVQTILNQMIGNEIYYINQYVNRKKETLIIILF